MLPARRREAARQLVSAVGQVEPLLGQFQKPALIAHAGGAVGQFDRIGRVGSVLGFFRHWHFGLALAVELPDLVKRCTCLLSCQTVMVMRGSGNFAEISKKCSERPAPRRRSSKRLRFLNFPPLTIDGLFFAALESISREDVASGCSTPSGRRGVPPPQRASAELCNESSIRNFRFRSRSCRGCYANHCCPWDFRSSQSRKPLSTLRSALKQVRSSTVTAPLPPSRRFGQAT